MSFASEALAILAGCVSGAIDSIAGGGGLITLPALSLLIGPSVEAIATNKIVGTCGALVAFLVYARQGTIPWREAIVFTIVEAVGSVFGSLISPRMPEWSFSVLMMTTCPLIFFLLYRKDLWVARELAHRQEKSATLFVLSALACGIYDGAWGPGGGTFMFLSLLFFGRLPLLHALTASKLVNTFSAGTSLVSYAIQGHVHWRMGAVMAVGVSVGAFFGARYASTRASRIVRPVLGLVTLLLLIKLAFR